MAWKVCEMALEMFSRNSGGSGSNGVYGSVLFTKVHGWDGNIAGIILDGNDV